MCDDALPWQRVTSSISLRASQLEGWPFVSLYRAAQERQKPLKRYLFFLNLFLETAEELLSKYFKKTLPKAEASMANFSLSNSA